MRMVAGLYDNYDDARRAVMALEDAGIPSDDISIATNKANGVDVEGQGSRAAEGAGTGAGLGALVGGAGGLLTGLGMLAIPGVGPVVAAGWLAATAAGVAAGAAAGGAVGGIVGAMVSEGVPEEDAQVYAEGIRRGGSVVAARVEEGRAAAAQSILDRARPVDIAARRASYVEQGWTRFDENADPYTLEQIAAERERYRSSL
ncbi:general stress protein [Rhizobium sp. YTU87027]|uniref:general stress protein n=1 Tax=Rhizobium sp. YTU87027 TaxID=3417741 RepID=UPI003D6940A3